LITAVKALFYRTTI